MSVCVMLKGQDVTISVPVYWFEKNPVGIYFNVDMQFTLLSSHSLVV
jgi:hypothetical protein